MADNGRYLGTKKGPNWGHVIEGHFQGWGGGCIKIWPCRKLSFHNENFAGIATLTLYLLREPLASYRAISSPSGRRLLVTILPSRILGPLSARIRGEIPTN